MTGEIREFTCMDCGVEALMVGQDHANDQDLCGTCRWLRNIENPQKRAGMRAMLVRFGIINR